MRSKFEEASVRTPTKSDPHFSNEDVYVKKSLFLTDRGVKGSGLYASRAYAVDDIIQEYTGKIISLKDCSKKKTHRNYFFEVRGANKKIIHVIDGANTLHAGPARYVNSIQFEDEVDSQNTKFVQRNKKIYLIAIKPIRKHDELISYYGKHTEDIIKMS